MNADSFTLDIVIPVYNEEAGIQNMLESLQDAVATLAKTHPETAVTMIAVDGGSNDKTCETLTQMGIPCVVAHAKGRGNQVAEGIHQLSGDWILILHADVVVKTEALSHLVTTISETPDLGWGILGHDYDRAGPLFWLTRLVNRLRFDCKKIGYGDQGQFVKRRILEEKGGFPAQPLMEDVELSLLLSDTRGIRLGEYLTASSRQWRNKGFWKYSIQNLRFALRYIKKRRAGASPDALSKEFYSAYYDN